MLLIWVRISSILYSVNLDPPSLVKTGIKVKDALLFNFLWRASTSSQNSNPTDLSLDGKYP